MCLLVLPIFRTCVHVLEILLSAAAIMHQVIRHDFTSHLSHKLP